MPGAVPPGLSAASDSSANDPGRATQEEIVALYQKALAIA
jgi:hypothetical protein